MSTTPFPIVAGLLCLDFVNTEPMQGGERVDLLVGFAALAQWLRDAGALSTETMHAALERWDGTSAAAATLREAVALRAGLRAGAERLVSGQPPGTGAVQAVNRVLAMRPAVRQLVRDRGAWRTRLQPLGESPLHLLVPVAESAAWLFEHGDRTLVQRCQGVGCVLFFYDTTKNHSRRWCSMEVCGSRAKAAAYYRRQRRG
jgi:predicted RNA-binding Zn ribbon-like protein